MQRKYVEFADDCQQAGSDAWDDLQSPSLIGYMVLSGRHIAIVLHAEPEASRRSTIDRRNHILILCRTLFRSECWHSRRIHGEHLFRLSVLASE